MKSATQSRLAFVIYMMLLVPGLIVFPFMVAGLFNAGSEAFFGDKEPMLQTMLGLLIGGILAAGAPAIRLAGWRRLGSILLISMLVFDVLAVPLCRWLIQTAYASPNHVIELW